MVSGGDDMGVKMRVGAIQMIARVAAVQENLKRAEELVEKAFSEGCQWVMLPEFFTTAMAFHPSMLDACSPLDGPALEMLCRQATKHSGYVGGSFVAACGSDRYNTYVLAFPDGQWISHDKDQPTMWENCYYIGGKDDGYMETPAGPIGAAVCWEMIRTRTARRLRGRVDLLVGGSCWWTVPDWPVLRGFWQYLHRHNAAIMEDTPRRLAKLLGCPVIHAAHAASFKGKMPLMPGIPYSSHLLGETQIVDAGGNILARLRQEEGEGVAIAEIDMGRISPSESLPEGFWIPRLPLFFRFIWAYQNLHGHWYYQRKINRH
jgi:predicted amidohydrolase